VSSTRIILFSLIGVTLSLLVVGAESRTILRHFIQVTPVGIASVVVAGEVRWGTSAAAAAFVFWLAIMTFIWLYLLGIARIVSGDFTAIEIVVTVIIGVSCVTGLAPWIRAPRVANFVAGAAAFALTLALQVGAMWLSLQPAFAHR
jgi:hypothetical protein